MAIIVLDPGHGGTARLGGSSPNNAVSRPRGILEKHLTLEVAKRAKALLQAAGHAVWLTRNADVNVALADRAALAARKRADIFVSIHFNGWTNAAAQGTETFSWPGAPSRSERLSQALLAKAVQATGYRNRGAKRETFGVIDPSRHLAITAACLVELSFITDPAEDARLDDAAYLQRLGEAIAAGGEAYLASQFPRPPARRAEDGVTARTGERDPA
ncbi:MAG TPA: N-acetylmuramoyl-L-alanine amidase [Phenylobacterium sp.]|nr:N-acetylmuramoyl-L-alanine amidase [Phenylobacterium sp.]